MKHQLLLFSSVGLVLFFFLVSLDGKPSITGASTTEENDASHALVLDNVITNFFGDEHIDFPDGGCGDIAKELYGNIAYSQLDVTAGYATTGSHRIATMNFVVDRTSKYGTVDMAKGSDVIDDGQIDSFISINSETIVRVPKEVRTTYFSMDLYGMSRGMFSVMHGSFSTPSVDCTFFTRDGRAICDCVSHPITGIRIAGITGLRPVEKNV
jgi:hypothetical protein